MDSLMGREIIETPLLCALIFCELCREIVLDIFAAVVY
jgi:hypothetical protein